MGERPMPQLLFTFTRGNQKMNEAIRAYQLHQGDIFSVEVESFNKTFPYNNLKDAIDLSKSFQILRVFKIKRKWWKIWKPKFTYCLKIMYNGNSNLV